MTKRQFKAESKRLLDLMINSIYTHHEIFLRELISNASDAIDKLYYNALSQGISDLNRDDMTITITPDENTRTLTIEDTGCGMTKEELADNLGVIAHSGSLKFRQEKEGTDDQSADIDIIGQFGVGFYSAFMVSKKVTVITRSAATGEAWIWQSTGSDGFTIEPGEKDQCGTKIILELKDNTDDLNYDEYLNRNRLSSLIRKYSDYIRYPIRMEMEKYRNTGSEDKPEYEKYLEEETINSMIPIWKKSASELGEDEIDNYYMDKFADHTPPLKVIRTSTEGLSTYTALLFVPGHAPYNYYSKDFQKGLKLYASGVLIMDYCPELLGDSFSFIRGIVDSQDLSLNISREMLQHDRQLKVIAKSLEKKIKNELSSMLKQDREKYEQFFKEFGLQLKYSLYSSFGANRELLEDLLLFHSSYEDSLVTLQEYCDRMPEEQQFIYYACGDNLDRLKNHPQAELVKDKGYEMLYLTQDVDEFTLKILGKYAEKSFKNVAEGDLGIETQEEKEAITKRNEEASAMLDLIKEALGDKVTAVRLSGRLKSTPVCISTEGGLSLEMEKVLNAMPGNNMVKAERVLEINSDHPIYATLERLYADDQDKLKAYGEILYTQALLLEGLLPEDSVSYTDKLCQLLSD